MVDRPSPGAPALPIDPLLPEVVDTVARARRLVLSAPPGAGKTTRVPLALLRAGVIQGQTILLQPRRIAARAVAEMMARSLGEPVGRQIGYRVRFDERSSAETRVLVVTEGILTRRMLADPLLEGVGCVILDEFHERSLHADLCLAFLRELMGARPELCVVVMSATIETGPVSAFLGGCPVLCGEVRQFPLSVQYAASPDRRPLPQRVRTALLELLRSPEDDGGDVLTFLPGAGEIRQCLALLEEQRLPGDPELVPLHGSLSAVEQDRALRPGQRRRVVLATNLAETSLTVPGVTAVLDSGLCKRLRHDARVGLDRLELGPVSQSSAEQRAGRAGRLGPGRALRLWTRAEQAAFAPTDPPEIARLDLAPALLAVLSFHPAGLEQFVFFESPPASSLERGVELLTRLGTLSRERRLTPRGRALAELPVHPRIGAMLLAGQGEGLCAESALLAALLGERDILDRSGGRAPALPTVSSDLFHRAELFLELEQGHFSSKAASRLGLSLGAAQEVRRARDQLLALCPTGSGRAGDRGTDLRVEARLRQVILAGYPDRVCRRRRPQQPEAVMVGGRGVRLGEESGVRDAELFLALEADAGRPGSHAASLVRQASSVDSDDLRRLFPEQLELRVETLWDDRRERVIGVERELFGDLVLGEREGLAIDPLVAEELLARAAGERFFDVYRPDNPAQQLVARLRLAAQHLSEESWPDVSEAGLRALLPEVCRGRRSLDDLSRADWGGVLHGQLSTRQRSLLDRELPERWSVPSGNRIKIDYSGGLDPGGAPVLAVKLQELFGLAETPRLARGRVPLLLHLLAPSGRPVQITRDLRSFWNEGYAEVRRTLRGRYPKHPWPEEPWSAEPTAATRRGLTRKRR